VVLLFIGNLLGTEKDSDGGKPQVGSLDFKFQNTVDMHKGYACQNFNYGCLKCQPTFSYQNQHVKKFKIK
jgi:hypothetical protein